MEFFLIVVYKYLFLDLLFIDFIDFILSSSNFVANSNVIIIIFFRVDMAELFIVHSSLPLTISLTSGLHGES